MTAGFKKIMAYDIRLPKDKMCPTCLTQAAMCTTQVENAPARVGRVEKPFL